MSGTVQVVQQRTVLETVDEQLSSGVSPETLKIRLLAMLVDELQEMNDKLGDIQGSVANVEYNTSGR